jgi:hypothetical protein
VAQVDFRVAAGDTAAAQSIASNLDATSLNAALTQQARRPVLARPRARTPRCDPLPQQANVAQWRFTRLRAAL